jgi:hypothetical protein
LFLAASGVGRISANDPQDLELSNLGRFLAADSLSEVGRRKVDVAAGFCTRRFGVDFHPIVARTEDEIVTPWLQKADWIISAGNTAESRITCAQHAVAFSRNILDVSVTDGGDRWLGVVKLRLAGAPSACPACYFGDGIDISAGGALLPQVVFATAALASHLVLQFAAGSAPEWWRSLNLWCIDLSDFKLETLAVAPRADCRVCSGMKIRF